MQLLELTVWNIAIENSLRLTRRLDSKPPTERLNVGRIARATGQQLERQHVVVARHRDLQRAIRAPECPWRHDAIAAQRISHHIIEYAAWRPLPSGMGRKRRPLADFRLYRE